MGFSVLRRGLGFCRSAAARMFTSRTYCSFSAPWLMLPPLFDDSGTGKVALNFHRLGNKEPIAFDTKKLRDKLDKVYFAGSSHGWLFAHNWMNRDAFLLNPITGRHIDLPPIRAEGGVLRVALSCAPNDDDKEEEEEEEECCAMVVFGRERSLAFCVPGRSTEWTPIGNGGRKYEDVAYSSTHKLFFCIASEYIPDLEGSWSVVEGWDMDMDMDMRLRQQPPRPTNRWRLQNDSNLLFDCRDYPWPARSETDVALKRVCWHLKYLLLHTHDLYVVVRHVNPRMVFNYDQVGPCGEPLYISKYRGWDASLPYKTFDFDVYKIDIDWQDSDSDSGSGAVRYMKCSLVGLAMFVGNNHSFAVPASSEEYPELKPNCIYFSDENSLMRKSISLADDVFGGHDNGIFDYQNNSFSSCCCGKDCPLNHVDYHDDIKRIEPPPMWFHPPPTLTH